MQEVERPVERGLKKSTAFHDASLLQAQLEEERRREEMASRPRLPSLHNV